MNRISTPDNATSANPLRLFLVDDHGLFCAGIQALLATEPDIEVVRQAHDDRSALEMIGADIDVLVIDVRLSGPSGISLVREIRRRGVTTPVLMLTMCRQRDFVFDAFAAGANGYALKTAKPPELVEAIRSVAAGQRYLAAELQPLRAELQSGGAASGPLTVLSARERDVFDLLVNGNNNAQIAARLLISEKTVETHRAKIFKKLDINTLPGLVRFAARHDLLVFE